MLGLKKLLTKILQSMVSIRQEKKTVSIPAISGGGYTSVAVPAPALSTGETLIGHRLIETDAALQLTLRYANGWFLNASNEYSGTATAHTAEVWWVIMKVGG